MKKYRFLPLVLLVLCFIMSSCSDDGIDKTNEQQEAYFLLEKSIGQLHNEGLARIHERAVANPKMKSSQEIELTIKEESWDFIAESFDDNPGIISYRQLHDSHFDGNYIAVSSKMEREMDKLILLVESNITELDENSGQDIFNLSRELLNQNPPAGLTESEVFAWRSAVDVMGSSALYWSENIDTWSYDDITLAKGFWSRLWKNIKTVVIADLAGAASGAVGAFVKVPTWESAAIGAAAGGLAGSAGAAVKELF